MKKFMANTRGKAYEQLIDFAIERTSFFVVADRYQLTERSEHCAALLARLKPYLVAERSYKELQGRNAIAYSEGTYYVYKCSEQAGVVLKEVNDSLYGWNLPFPLEDLCFLDAEGKDFLINIAHEEIGRIDIDEVEAELLSQNISGLFIKLEAHSQFDRFLDDAIRHQVDKLHITSFGITEIPDRIGELQQLKHLEIFDQNIKRLPPGLFDIHTLESLSIMTANLESIPKDIGNLTNLKSLTIYCGSYDQPAIGRKVIAKSDVSIDSLPPEIGELQQLEQLSIGYTRMKELPEEIVKLQKLRTLNAGNNMLTGEPAFLPRMKNLKYVNFSDSPFGIVERQ